MEYLIGGDLRAVMDAHRRLMRDFPVAMGVHCCVEVLKACVFSQRADEERRRCTSFTPTEPVERLLLGRGRGEAGRLRRRDVVARQLRPWRRHRGGKLSYLSPEQTRGEKLTPASDVFAVGVMMHEMVSAITRSSKRARRRSR